MEAQKKTEKKQNKGISLHITMVLLVLGCCMLPILLLVGVVGALAIRGNSERVSQLVTISIESALDGIDGNLEGIINDALGASYDPTIRNAYTQYGLDGNWPEMYDSAHSFLTHKYSRNPLLMGAYLLLPGVADNEENLIYALSPEKATYQDFARLEQSDFEQKVLEMVPQLGSELHFFYHEDRLFMVRALSQRENSFEPYAALVLELDTQAVFSSLTQLPWITDAFLQLDRAPLALVGEDRFDTPAPEEADSYHTREEGGFLTVWGNSTGSRFSIDYWVRADMHQLQEGFNPALLMVGLGAIAVILVAVVFLFLYRKVTRPIAELGRMTGKIEQGEFGVQVDIEKMGSREFKTLGRNLNAMSTRLDYQFERLFSEELALRDAKIKALQSQINPQFLGNTLEIVNWQARMDGNTRVSQMLESLSTMIKATQDAEQKPYIHLSGEMTYVNSYLYIVGERHGKRLDVRKEIDEELLDWLVPRLVLQPIVENAVEHGAGADMRGWLIIRAYQLEKPPPLPESQSESESLLRQEFAAAEEGRWFCIEVENNDTMSEEEKARVALLLSGKETGAATGGISNVNQRLRMIYGPRSGLTIYNTEDGTTMSRICLMKRSEAPSPQQDIGRLDPTSGSEDDSPAKRESPTLQGQDKEDKR
ncbi:histidine kinase [Ruminococcaceae bacterium OttesenSCG-928-I18]|nr:histidine kinase [Ruminococcaceae bacterium OttesenSCG-928-I18]